MPRPPRPRWNARRNRWVANIGPPGKDGRSREVAAPASVKGEPQAWAWMYAAIEGRPDAAEPPDPPGPPTLHAVCQAYLDWIDARIDNGQLNPEYAETTAATLNRVLRFRPVPGGPTLAERPADSIGLDDLDALVGAMTAEGLAASYRNEICKKAKQALAWASKPARDRPPLIASNPLAEAKAPAREKPPSRFAGRDVAARWLAHWRRRTHPKINWDGSPSVLGRTGRNMILMQRCLIHTGARPKELCKLEWADITWDAGRTSAGHAYAVGRLPPTRWKAGRKTGRWRSVYFMPRVRRALLREFVREGRHPTHVFYHASGFRGRGGGEPWKDGSAICSTIARVRAEVPGLFVTEGPNRMVSYIWRHTAASSMLMNGIDPTTVAEILGTSVNMLTSTYAHILDGHVASALDSFHTNRRRPRGPS